MNLVKNDLFDYANRYIFQYEKGFKFSLDSLLLAEFIEISNKDKVIIDFCTGNAPIPLILSTKINQQIIGFEIQEEIAELAKKSIEYNNLDNKIKIINDNINNALSYIDKSSVDIISCNPPYFKISDSKVMNEDKLLRIARHEVHLKLENIFKIASDLLKTNGKLHLIHRVNRVDDIINLANIYNIRVKEIILIDTKNDFDFSIALIKCVKNSKSGLKIKIKQIKGMKTYQNIFKES